MCTGRSGFPQRRRAGINEQTSATRSGSSTSARKFSTGLIRCIFQLQSKRVENRDSGRPAECRDRPIRPSPERTPLILMTPKGGPARPQPGTTGTSGTFVRQLSRHFPARREENSPRSPLSPLPREVLHPPDLDAVARDGAEGLAVDDAILEGLQPHPDGLGARQGASL